MPRYKLTLEYDGTGLCGWQRQDGLPSVQQHVEEAIDAFCQQQVTITAAGRTDAGVHALGQVAHCDLHNEYAENTVRDALNAHLTHTNISILAAEIVPADFHARFSAKQRHYTYKILNRKAPPSLRKGRVWHIIKPLNIVAMQDAATCLIGNHDFSSFRASECQSDSPVKTLDKIDINKLDDEIHVHIAARSFLHHMVRNIVGTLMPIGHAKYPPEEIKTILEAKDRSCAGQTAPACGLYFTAVIYQPITF